MITDKAIPDNCSHTPVNGKLQKFASAFIIPAPCIICEDKLVKVGDTYDLVDFLDNDLDVRAVKIMNAYMMGYNVIIVVLDLKAGELIKRRHRLDNDILPCNWVLTDLFSTNSKKDDELLEFEF